MKKRNFLMLAAVTLLSVGSVLAKQPNIVWIMLEDWCPDMSCYGTKGIDTPVCDQLATEGVRYTNAFCTSPVCSPSRSAMMTGFHQNYINANQHRTARKSQTMLPHGIKPLPVLLKEAGYYTCTLKSRKTDCNFKTPLGFDDNKSWKGRAPGQPFFAQVTLAGTHRKWTRDPQRPVDPSAVELPPYYADTPLARRDWANGLESMQICDRQVGEVLNMIEKEGETEHTLVFLIGDNGRCHIRGKQFLYDPGLRVPVIVRWPGVIAPGQVNDDLIQTIDITATIMKAAGVASPHALHGKDLLNPDGPERKFVYAARDKMDDTHDAIRMIRSKRYKLIHNLMPERPWLQLNTYKERMYPMLAEMNVLHMQGKLNPVQAAFFADRKPEFELYDLQDDPHETKTLADDPSMAKRKADLLVKLNAWRKSINDQGVSDAFRKGGNSATYPTRSLEAWQAAVAQWKPWVFRAPDSTLSHPFLPKKVKKGTGKK